MTRILTRKETKHYQKLCKPGNAFSEAATKAKIVAPYQMLFTLMLFTLLDFRTVAHELVA